QAGGATKLTTAADVYGLGAIQFELLTGRPPHRGATFLDTLVLVREHEPPRPRSLNPRLDRDLETICLKCLHKDPAQRYGSAEALAAALALSLAPEPIRARRTSAWERAAKWARRQPVTAALLATVLLLAGCGFAAVTWLWQTADMARTAAQQAEQAKEQQR